MKRATLLWIAVLMGPTIWFAGFLANFALVPWACAFGWKPALFVVTLISLAVTAGAGALAWRLWQQTGVDLPGETGGAVARDRSLALAAVLLSGMFVLVIVAQCVPNLILGACQ